MCFRPSRRGRNPACIRSRRPRRGDQPHAGVAADHPAMGDDGDLLIAERGVLIQYRLCAGDDLCDGFPFAGFAWRIFAPAAHEIPVQGLVLLHAPDLEGLVGDEFVQVGFHQQVKACFTGDDRGGLQRTGVGRGDNQLAAGQTRVGGDLCGLLAAQIGQGGKVAPLSDEATHVDNGLVRLAVADEDDSHGASIGMAVCSSGACGRVSPAGASGASWR